MLNEKELMQIATNEMIKIFGKKYLQDNYKNTCRAYGMIDARTFQLFLGLKDSEDLPDREADSKGWTVYGKVLVNVITGEIVDKEYITE
jgi:hypothetical protein